MSKVCTWHCLACAPCERGHRPICHSISPQWGTWTPWGGSRRQWSGYVSMRYWEAESTRQKIGTLTESSWTWWRERGRGRERERVKGPEDGNVVHLGAHGHNVSQRVNTRQCVTVQTRHSLSPTTTLEEHLPAQLAYISDQNLLICSLLKRGTNNIDVCRPIFLILAQVSLYRPTIARNGVLFARSGRDG